MAYVLDETFGASNNGKVFTDISGNLNDIALSIVLDSANNIFLGGIYFGDASGRNFAICKYTPDGLLDTSFGPNSDGKVQTDFSGNSNDSAYKLLIDASGKLLFGGFTDASGGQNNFAMARYDATSGALDNTFGTNGLVFTDTIVGSGGDKSESLWGLAIDTATNDIIQGGMLNSAGAETDSSFCIVKYNSAGLRYTSGFGTGGLVVTDFSGQAVQQMYSLIIHDGNIYSCGAVDISGGTKDFAIFKCALSDGTADVAFGPNNDGKVIMDIGNAENVATNLVIDSNAGIILVGSGNNAFTITRLSASDGSLDTSFGVNGVTQVSFGLGSESTPYSLVIDSNNNILVGGQTAVSGPAPQNFGIVRLTSTGILDTSFGSGGKIITDISGGIAYDILIDSNNRILLAGHASENSSGFTSNNNFAMVRYALSSSPAQNICFVGDTPIVTDQGIININRIKSSVNTINGRKIVAVTKSITPEKYLVCFKKDALGPNIPSKDTTMSMGHKVFYDGVFVEAAYFTKKFAHVKLLRNTHRHLYNILFNNHSVLEVNNMLTESLDPNNVYAQLLNGDTMNSRLSIRKTMTHKNPPTRQRRQLLL